MRPRRQVRGRGQAAPRRGRRRARRPQARRKRPQRARLHRRRQDGLLQQLLPRRRLPLQHLPLHRSACLQARRGGSPAQRRGPAVKAPSSVIYTFHAIGFMKGWRVQTSNLGHGIMSFFLLRFSWMAFKAPSGLLRMDTPCLLGTHGSV